MKKKKEIKIMNQEIEKARKSCSVSAQFLNRWENEGCKEEIIQYLKPDQFGFLDNAKGFFEALDGIKNNLKLTWKDFQNFRKDHIGKKSLLSMNEWKKGKLKSSVVGVLITIFFAMARKFIPLGIRYLTSENRNPQTSAFLNFLLNSNCEPQNIRILREEDHRESIRKKIEKELKTFIRQIKLELHFRTRSTNDERTQLKLLDKALLAIDKTKGLCAKRAKRGDSCKKKYPNSDNAVQSGVTG